MANLFVGARSGSICIVSSSPILTHDPNIEIIEVPDEYKDASNAQLVTNFRVVNGQIRPRRRRLPTKKLKLAFVGNWKMKCGIATYSENLLPEVAKHFGDFKLFIEKNDNPTGPLNVIGDVVVPTEKIVSCWKRGETLQHLINEIKAYDPDVIWIQHEFGIWCNASYWLSMMNQLSDYRIIVTMHSVFHHRDKTIVEAAIPEIIVHLDGAKNVLQHEKGITAPIHVLPHGCAPVTDVNRLWNFYKSDHTIVQWGFGFAYKGWEEAIKIAHILKQKYSDVFLTGLFSESQFNAVGHQVYYDQLMRLINDLDMSNNIALIRGYQSDAALDSYLRTNKVALFPYVSNREHEVFGASGAARYAMTKMLPVVTSNVNHFSDLPTLKGDNPTQIADVIDRMFSNGLAYKAQVDKQVSYIEENTWEKVALRHVELFSGV